MLLSRIVLLSAFLLQMPPSPLPPVIGRGRRGEDRSDVLLPNGKSQKREILKADFAKSRADAGELVELALQLKQDLDREDPNVLDLRTVKKAEEIEKLAKRIKDRMRTHM
jgi:hypothetical protein